MKHKIILLMNVVLISGVAQAMQPNQEEKRGDADRDADSVREWLLEGVEVVEMEELVQGRIERLFPASWHRNILKEYALDMVSDALTQLEHLADFQALANSQADSQENGRQLVERESESQILDGGSVSRAKLERACMIALLSKLGHAEKIVAEDKREQGRGVGNKLESYICWIVSLGLPSLLTGALWPVIRCGP